VFALVVTNKVVVVDKIISLELTKKMHIYILTKEYAVL